MSKHTQSNQSYTEKYTVFCGGKETMEAIASHGAKGLNPRTMKYQIIDKNAQYEVVKTGEVLHDLLSDIDLRGIAEKKGLIL